MSTFWPAPSRYSFADKCGFPWAANGPKWPKRLPYEPEDAQRHGNAISRMGELLAVWGGDALALLPEVFADPEVQITAPQKRLVVKACVDHMRDYLDSRVVSFRAAEVALELDMKTGACRAVDKLEARRPKSGCVGGMIDLLEIENDELVISDWKSGWMQARTLDIRNDPQLRAYALMALRYGVALGLKFKRVTIRLLHVSEEGIRPDEDYLDALETGIIRAEMQARFDRIAGIGAPNVGSHCKRCPVLTSCPAVNAGVHHAIKRMNRLPVVQDVREIQDADHAAYSYNLGMFLAEEGKRLQAMAKQWVIEVNDKKPIELGPNTMFGPVLTNGSEGLTLDVNNAVEVVRKHLGDGPAWAAAVEVVASKASLEKGAKLIAAKRSRESDKRVTVKSVIEPLLEELRSIGSLRRGAPIEKMTEFPKAKQQEYVP